jgi:phage/plasmid-associated DNA primase
MATQGYLADQDTLQRWGEKWCVLGPKEQMGAAEGFEAYQNWCYANHEPVQAGPRNFSAKFTAKFPQCMVNRVEAGTVIMGARLVTADDPGDPSILP